MRTEYEAVEFKKKGDDWYCHDGEGRIGLVYYGLYTKIWYYKSRDMGHTAQQLTDIADFLQQLNEAEK